MKRFKNKELINTLLLIDTIFGDYTGKTMPILILIVLAGLPLLIWLFLLQGTPIKLWWVAIADIPWTLNWALILVFDEKGKMERYDEQLKDAAKAADELVHIVHTHEDGLIEYDFGAVAYIISGYLKDYLNDDKLSYDLEMFMNELDFWDWDLYMHTSVDELLCEENLPNLKRYVDKEVIQERIDFYAHQDEWARTHSGLYRVSFLVTCHKSDWKKMKSHLSELVTSELAFCFNQVEILDHDGVDSLANRDICGFANITKMLMSKYDNEQYHSSKVMWYGDNIPEEMIPKSEYEDVSERRQTEE